jgi:uncharacterized linocin/CFP29 family protein
MNNMRRIGNATGALTDYELNYVDTAIVKTVRPLLKGRTLMPAKSLANAGITKYTYYTESDMSEPTISMTGEEQSMDAVDLAEHTVKIPIISKDYNLHWRDVLSRRNNGEDLNTQHATNAARQIAEIEDRLIFSGESATGVTWPALGIEGFTTATGRNEYNGGDFSSTYLADVAGAMAMLEDDGYYGPYKFCLTSAFYQQLRVLVGTTDSFAFQTLEDLLGGPGSIIVTNSIYASDGAQDSSLLIDTSPGNFELLVGSDVSNNLAQLPTMNYQGKVWEAVVPVIKRPESICEINTMA